MSDRHALPFGAGHPALADAKPIHLGHTIKADGRWRLFAFAAAEGPAVPASRVRALCEFLAASPHSPVRRYTPPGADVDAVIDVRAVFQQPHRELALEAAIPPFLCRARAATGCATTKRCSVAEFKSGADIFDLRGIDRQNGCIVIVRPDQYVAHVLPLDAYAELSAFFDGFMIRPPA